MKAPRPICGPCILILQYLLRDCSTDCLYIHLTVFLVHTHISRAVRLTGVHLLRSPLTMDESQISTPAGDLPCTCLLWYGVKLIADLILASFLDCYIYAAKYNIIIAVHYTFFNRCFSFSIP